MSFNFPSFCSHIFPFEGISPAKVAFLLPLIAPDLRSFVRGETVFEAGTGIRKIGFVVNGECEVVRITSDGGDFPMNLLHPYDSFGVLSLFSERGRYPTVIRAKKKSEVLFLKRDDVLLLIRENRDVALNFITFLAGRAVFLNEKVAALSGASAEEKIASYLFVAYKKAGCDTFALNCKQASEKLRLSRASVYRALDALAAHDLIRYGEKQITILDPQGLERKSS
ncbi:MAG TPA: hypothetical protein DDY70_06365 [Clostridiales bacterium]|nr:hypothetical protein [Clostridiales bacterium]